MIYMLSMKEQQAILDEWKRSHHIGAAGKKILNKKKYNSTNLEFSRKDENFKAACDEAGIPSTGRQVSKYRNGYGLVFNSK